MRSPHMLPLIPAYPHSHLLFPCFCCKQLGNVSSLQSPWHFRLLTSHFYSCFPSMVSSVHFPFASHISLNIHSFSFPQQDLLLPHRHHGPSRQGTCTLTCPVCSAQQTSTQDSSFTLQSHPEGQSFSPCYQPEISQHVFWCLKEFNLSPPLHFLYPVAKFLSFIFKMSPLGYNFHTHTPHPSPLKPLQFLGPSPSRWPLYFHIFYRELKI